MPIKTVWLVTVAVQVFSMFTFFSLWIHPGSEEYVKKQQIETFTSAFSRRLDPTRNKDKYCNLDVPRDPLATKCLPSPNIDGTCSMYIRGNKKRIQPLKFNPTGSRKYLSCRLTELLKNCDTLRTAHGYITERVSAEENDFPLAFSIKLHRDPEQVEQLLRTIYRPQNVYCLYVDGKAHQIVYNLIFNISRCFPNVHVIRDRVKVIYASSAHVVSEMQCMRKCTESKVKWKYYINLTGQEFPLRTNLEIVRILKSLNGANDIESYNHPVLQTWRFSKKYRLTETSNVETTEDKEPFRYKLQLSKGSAYGSFSRDFVNFILKDNVAQEFIAWLNNTYSPEENVWATLNTLPWAPGGYEMETRHTFGNFLSRATIWDNDKESCEGRYVRGVCVFGRRDLTWLTSRPQLFANKFNYKMDNMAIDCLEDIIRNRTILSNTDNLNWFYYINLPHAKYYSTHSKDAMMLEYSGKKEQWLRAQASNTGNDNVAVPTRTEKSDTLHVLGGTMTMYKVHGEVL
ncbi:beta-1,3-galactosyl-O-glycosyl-glycoprotein beta-1,6-N-acetylglucosaminyltransferase 3-like [Mizuhopecten yessoensis]|uniref:Beta-1,3-galactosyl-O-glycosyl-glycoprotein beta-1,6-N-acetylglucosaminyltransferase 3 n=1 Tax=Mizuhopecten yessoensis TaxID=6573 RepID=A0A210QND7_MIZYE|nr:beta-1,3-galactosyl-O-glycosyl-glycoprotein beta-1,6-N-acetylglucosaminyltransferase 3-like [Mizuhopecten yessoensis]OWF50253.1 Beta-1,3-galactosyl-O-glycosyl-glycoprotein beta-1,6-N-acetylglucosaminyltransferase 3 [Mizuhopecten yessoensis]